MKKTVLSVLVVLSLVMFSTMNCAAEPAKSAGSDAININTASAEELMDLNGVGKAIAEKIIAYRTANGPFQKPDDIMQVSGIGQAIFEKNKEKITVGELKPKS